MKLVACLIFILSVSLPASGESLLKKPGKIIHQSNLHKLPKNGSAVLSKLAAEQDVTVVSRERAWYQVFNQHDDSGWVKMLNVRFVAGPKRAGELGVKNLYDSVISRNVIPTESTGIRGFDEEDLKNAQANPEQLVLLDSYKVKTGEAEAFAKQGGLATKVEVPLNSSVEEN